MAHFLLKHGTLAISGQPFFDKKEGSILIDISDVDRSCLDAIILARDALCVCESDDERWSFNIENLSVQRNEDHIWLACDFPRATRQWPSRQADRLSLLAGDALIAIDGHRLNLANLSQGGCAFRCEDIRTSSWPPGRQVACTISYGANLSLDCEISIIRIEHDLCAPDKENTLVSCQFVKASSAALIEAAILALRP